MRRTCVLMRSLFCAGLAVWPGGCAPTTIPASEVEIPAEAQVILDAPRSFQWVEDDPLATVEPGTVIDDLADLTGCWGTVLKESDADPQAALFIVYRFDRETADVTRWSGYADVNGGLWAAVPLIGADLGSFEVQGESELLLTFEQSFSNVDFDTGQITRTLNENPRFGDPVERSAVVTLDGDAMLLFIDAETPDDVGDELGYPIFRRFDCPGGE